MDDRVSEDIATAAAFACRGERWLLTGLGIGYLPAWLIRQNWCRHITIVENSFDVMRLVLEPLHEYRDRFGTTPTIRIAVGDADIWRPVGEDPYDVIWLDHWFLPKGEAMVEEFAKWQPYGKTVLGWNPGYVEATA
jgi:spermidine synthase